MVECDLFRPCQFVVSRELPHKPQSGELRLPELHETATADPRPLSAEVVATLTLTVARLGLPLPRTLHAGHWTPAMSASRLAVAS